jgi:hypothetical protein
VATAAEVVARYHLVMAWAPRRSGRTPRPACVSSAPTASSWTTPTSTTAPPRRRRPWRPGRAGRGRHGRAAGASNHATWRIERARAIAQAQGPARLPLRAAGASYLLARPDQALPATYDHPTNHARRSAGCPGRGRGRAGRDPEPGGAGLAHGRPAADHPGRGDQHRRPARRAPGRRRAALDDDVRGHLDMASRHTDD